MAFQQAKTLDGQLTASYWRIVSIDIDYTEPIGRVVLAGYKDKETRLAYPKAGIAERIGPVAFTKEEAPSYLTYEDALPIRATWGYLAPKTSKGLDPDLAGAYDQATDPMKLTWDVQNRRTKGYRLSRWSILGVALNWVEKNGTLRYGGYISEEDRQDDLGSPVVSRQRSYGPIFDLFHPENLEAETSFAREDAYHLLSKTESFSDAAAA